MLFTTFTSSSRDMVDVLNDRGESAAVAAMDTMIRVSFSIIRLFMTTQAKTMRSKAMSEAAFQFRGVTLQPSPDGDMIGVQAPIRE
jgi:hypothetical protein